MPKRMDGADTIEMAVHYIAKMASEGWVLDNLEHQIEYAQLSPKAPRLPMKATVTITLIPVRGA